MIYLLLVYSIFIGIIFANAIDKLRYENKKMKENIEDLQGKVYLLRKEVEDLQKWR